MLPPRRARERMERIQHRFPPAADDVVRGDAWVVAPGREIAVRLYRPGPGPQARHPLPARRRLGRGQPRHARRACAALARDADAVVASVHYRRAPENPFPAPNDDAYAALAWFAAQADALDVDARRIGVAGDSAGAHLALGLAIEARDRGAPPLAMQLLVYPVVEPAFDTPSYLAHANSPTLPRADMIAYWRAYLPDGGGDARAVPTRDSLRGLPPAHVVVAELDPLHDEGVLIAERLRAAGVRATSAVAGGLPHGFLRAAPYVASARAAQAALGAATRQLLHR